MKRETAAFAIGVCAATCLSIAAPLSRLLVWNMTASVPTGLYLVRGTGALRIGERVAIDPPMDLRHYLAARGYLPPRMPLLKEVAALGGDTVCRHGRAVSIGGKQVATARPADSRGRRLPVWSGCRTLEADEIFVLGARSPDSFDGRYFGPLPTSSILGRASPVWTDETGIGEHVWFARPTLSDTNTPHEGD